MILSYRDIQRIQKLGYDLEFFVHEYKGWLQLKNNMGRCVFHNGTGCTIYRQRPKGCTLYPVVYDKDNRCAILDSECPQRHWFSLSKVKENQLKALVLILEKERIQRMQEEKKKEKK
jgi:Fe-S-cluster containining protein